MADTVHLSDILVCLIYNLSYVGGSVMTMIAIYYILFACFILFVFNSLTNRLCIEKNIPVERQVNVFRWINIMITILLVSSYVEVLYAS